MRYLAFFLSFIFLTFAVVQYNDSDAILWILIYLIPSVFYLLAYRRKTFPVISLGVSLVYLFCAICVFDYSIDWINSKTGKEGAGLFLSAIGIFCSRFFNKRAKLPFQ